MTKKEQKGLQWNHQCRRIVIHLSFPSYRSATTFPDQPPNCFPRTNCCITLSSTRHLLGMDGNTTHTQNSFLSNREGTCSLPSLDVGSSLQHGWQGPPSHSLSQWLPQKFSVFHTAGDRSCSFSVGVPANTTITAEWPVLLCIND